MKLHRLTLAGYADAAFTGEGTRRVGSRWTPVGYPAVYLASSVALAVLETLAHADWSVMPTHRLITVEIPSSVPIATVDFGALPPDWRATPPPATLSGSGAIGLMRMKRPCCVYLRSWYRRNSTSS